MDLAKVIAKSLERTKQLYTDNIRLRDRLRQARQIGMYWVHLNELKRRKAAEQAKGK